MAKRISKKRAKELWHKEQAIRRGEMKGRKKIEKHVKKKSRLKTFLSGLKSRYMNTNRPDLAVTLKGVKHEQVEEVADE
jgi:hypothetical protein